MMFTLAAQDYPTVNTTCYVIYKKDNIPYMDRATYLGGGVWKIHKKLHKDVVAWCFEKNIIPHLEKYCTLSSK